MFIPKPKEINYDKIKSDIEYLCSYVDTSKE